MHNKGVKGLLLSVLILTTFVTFNGRVYAQDETGVAAKEAVAAVEQGAEQVDTGASSKETSPGSGVDAPDPAAVPRRGTLFWDKVLSVVGLHEEKPFKPEQITGAPTGPVQDYIIGPGDQLGISVWRDDALTRVVAVLPDGKIQFPLIGEVVAGGRTVAQLKKEIEEKLAGFVVDSGLSVEVRQSNSLFIYLIGKVNVPGRQMLLANTNVLQALAMAGGLNPFAEKDDVKIFRQEGGQTLIYPFRYSLVSAGSNLEENIWLKRGDVIVVP